MDEDITMLEQTLNLKSDTITTACSRAMKAHHACGNNKAYLVKDMNGQVTFSFPGAWTVADWYSTDPFGDTKINQTLFPSIKAVGLDEFAKINRAFQTRFEAVLQNSLLKKEVEKADSKKKQLVFTGHSSGASLAILATLWVLENHLKSNVTNLTNPICITFGAPLVGDRIFHHAVQRQKWSGCFINFVTKRDIVPRILLVSLTSIEQQLQPVLNYLKSISGVSGSDNFPSLSLDFYMNVMINASSTVSNAASKLMGCSNMLMDTLAKFSVQSPYRPFGTYVFLTGNKTACVLRNPDAILQLLFYSCQVENEENICSSLKDHASYVNELNKCLSNNIINLEHCLENLYLTSDGGVSQIISKCLDDLGVSTQGRICILAAGELKKQKERNEAKVNGMKDQLIAGLKKLEDYKAVCELRKMCYYDAFKLSQHENDFQANLQRLKLAGMWDEIIDLLKSHNLPDDFEGNAHWIQLGTQFRRVMEPLDIANYYRHDKDKDTGTYLKKGRPKRYRFTQRWLEHFKREPSSESCMWAEVEQFLLTGSEVTRAEIFQLEKNIEKWIQEETLSKDVFLENSTLVKWWIALGPAHATDSPIAKFMPTP